MRGLKFVFILFFSLMAMVSSATTIDANLPPDQLVEKVSNNVLNEIRKDPALAQAEPAHVRLLVDEHILPYTDFPRMTKMAVGPGWRKATEAQRNEIQQLFRQLLTAVYSGALKEASSYRVVLKNNKFTLTDRTVLIRTQLNSPSHEPIQLDYRLLNNGKDWKIFDVNVGGVWLIENYRSQFGSVINSHGIEGLIQQLKDRVSKLEKQNS